MLPHYKIIMLFLFILLNGQMPLKLFGSLLV